MASVKWSADALQDLEKIDQIIARRIIEKIGWLEENFSDIVPEPLHRELKGLYKLRIGDFRAVYSTHQGLIIIEAVGHRRDVYK
ncbi:MAG: type II toxin-antitoxin system RelE/ParE family toxin [bacterium]|nr:type II toxin-antitoxin system RelE/ParE family toxin [bacterium]